MAVPKLECPETYAGNDGVMRDGPWLLPGLPTGVHPLSAIVNGFPSLSA